MHTHTMATPRILLCVAGLGLFLTACGGGGGGSPVAAPAPTVTVVSNFSSLTPPGSFAWTSQQSASSSGVTINKSTGGSLGNVRVTVSNFIETDPTGSGAAIPAMSTDVLTYALGGSTVSSSATISFGKLTLSSGTQQVLVEVFSTSDGSRLGGGKFSVNSLLAGSATLTL